MLFRSEAELLTGKDLNLEKAREAALNNDIATLSKEIGKNQEVLNAFSSGNRIQQDAIAKSLGMSRDDMANMVYQQKIQNGLSSEQAAKAADISLEQAKQLTTGEQIKKATEKLTELLGMMLTPLTWILENKVALYTVFSVITLALLPKMVSGIKSFSNSLKVTKTNTTQSNYALILQHIEGYNVADLNAMPFFFEANSSFFDRLNTEIDLRQTANFELRTEIDGKYIDLRNKSRNLFIKINSFDGQFY